MVRGGAGVWKPSPLAVVVIAAAFALVGNLATNTVQVSWRWWPAVVWTAAAVLEAATVGMEWARHRATTNQAQAAGSAAVRVFGAIPLPAWRIQDRPVETGMLRRALGGHRRAALVALPGARGAGKTQLAAYRSSDRYCAASG